MVRIWVVVVLLGLARAAQADVPSPAVAACHGKDVGAACAEEFGDGACAKSTCSRTRPSPDGKTETTTWECLQCEVGAEVEGGNLRAIIGIAVAVLVIGLGIWLARTKAKPA